MSSSSPRLVRPTVLDNHHLMLHSTHLKPLPGTSLNGLIQQNAVVPPCKMQCHVNLPISYSRRQWEFCLTLVARQSPRLARHNSSVYVMERLFAQSAPLASINLHVMPIGPLVACTFEAVFCAQKRETWEFRDQGNFLGRIESGSLAFRTPYRHIALTHPAMYKYSLFLSAPELVCF